VPAYQSADRLLSKYQLARQLALFVVGKSFVVGKTFAKVGETFVIGEALLIVGESFDVQTDRLAVQQLLQASGTGARLNCRPALTAGRLRLRHPLWGPEWAAKSYIKVRDNADVNGMLLPQRLQCSWPFIEHAELEEVSKDLSSVKFDTTIKNNFVNSGDLLSFAFFSSMGLAIVLVHLAGRYSTRRKYYEPLASEVKAYSAEMGSTVQRTAWIGPFLTARKFQTSLPMYTVYQSLIRRFPAAKRVFVRRFRLTQRQLQHVATRLFSGLCLHCRAKEGCDQACKPESPVTTVMLSKAMTSHASLEGSLPVVDFLSAAGSGGRQGGGHGARGYAPALTFPPAEPLRAVLDSRAVPACCTLPDPVGDMLTGEHTFAYKLDDADLQVQHAAWLRRELLQENPARRRISSRVVKLGSLILLSAPGLRCSRSAGPISKSIGNCCCRQLPSAAPAAESEIPRVSGVAEQKMQQQQQNSQQQLTPLLQQEELATMSIAEQLGAGEVHQGGETELVLSSLVEAGLRASDCIEWQQADRAAFSRFELR
uniref:Guanylate cyclase domain-containing protein n=1 Tax=Macrostomum lignano TaxID=282301 RepID=A0A1I8FQH7_9PLAT